MNAPPIRAVYDCNILLQATLSGDGPAFRCLSLLDGGRVQLLMSEAVLAEIRDVLSRPEILRKNLQVTPERVAQFLSMLARKARFIEEVPAAISFPRDPKDQPYLDLAIAADAQFLVTRDAKHLLKFAVEESPEALDFRAKYPTIRIVDPAAFLHEMDLRIDAGKRAAQQPTPLPKHRSREIDRDDR